MSTLAPGTYPGHMSENTEDTRVTREAAAEAAGVSVRTISRWRAKKWITVRRDRSFRKPATYSLREVMDTAERMGHVSLPDAD